MGGAVIWENPHHEAYESSASTSTTSSTATDEEIAQ